MNKKWKIVIGGLMVISISLVLFFAMHIIVKAVTNIDSSDKWAWSDVSGWWDLYAESTVEVQPTKMTGYASSTIGDISFDCATTRNGDICSTSDYKVCNGDSSGVTCTADADGDLSGCAWNDEIGWISFWCGDYDCQGGNTCSSSNYRVTIDANGNFNNYAWNDIDGWISFNCADPGVCGSSNYKVNTSWRAGKVTGDLTSSIFDTQVKGILNSIIWQGAQPSGTCVKYQLAVSNSSSGPWTYYGPGQDTGAHFGNSCPGPNTSIKITGTDRSWVNNQQYLRYKFFLESNNIQTLTPTVNNIILNWSP